jgi:hypothetical protein
MRLSFEHAPDGSACGTTSQTTSDVVQSVMLFYRSVPLGAPLRPSIAARNFLRQDVPNWHHYRYPVLFSLGLRRIPRYPVAKARG